MKIKFGNMTTGEINVMLTASSESGNQLAGRILKKQKGRVFDLTALEASYLASEMELDVDRVSQACGEAAGRAFERGAEKIRTYLSSQPEGEVRK